MTKDSEKLAALYSFALFLRYSVLPAGYQFPTEFGQSIILTVEGERWLQELRANRHPDISDSDGKAALLSEFAVDDQLLIDTDLSDIQAVRSFLDQACRNGGVIRFPFVYGRTIDDIFVNIFGNTPRKDLTPDETVELLDRSPAGVFQSGLVIVGPLGLIDSNERRYLIPTLYGPIVHCTDPGCTALHPVLLKTGKTEFYDAYLDILPERFLNRDLSAEILSSISPRNQHSVDYAGTLPWLLTNGYAEPERKLLIKHVWPSAG